MWRRIASGFALTALGPALSFGVPLISTQPADVTVTAGSNATFSVTATSNSTLGYQWRRDGYALPGATTKSLTITGASQGDNDFYDVLLTDGTGSQASDSARLLVAPASYPGKVAADLSRSLRLESRSGMGSSGGSVMAQAVLPDGRFLVAGMFTAVNDVPRAQLVRFNADGTLDTTYAPASFDFAPGALAVQSDGKVLVGGQFKTVNGVPVSGIARLNTDGSWDPGFVASGLTSSSPSHLFVAPDQSIYASGYFQLASGNWSYVIKLTSSGNVVTSFVSPDFFTGSSGTNPQGFSCGPSGEIYTWGWFDHVNGVAAPGLARLKSDGSVDTSFNIGTGLPNGGAYNVVGLSNGQVVLGGSFTSFNGHSVGNIVRLNHDGSIDTTFAMGTGFSGAVAFVTELPGNALFAAQFGGGSYDGTPTGVGVRLTATGALDSSFSYSLASYPTSLNVLPNGHFLVGGALQYHPWGYFAGLRVLDTNGSVLVTPTLRFPGTVYFMAPLAGGKIVVAGDIDYVNGTPVNNVFRLNADLTVDSTFTGAAGSAGSVPVCTGVVQPDGKIILLTVAGKLRLNADGTLDSTFDQSGLIGFWYSGPPAVLPNGTIFVPCSSPNWADGAGLNGFVLLDSTGHRATTNPFGSGAGSGGSVYDARRLPHGQLLVTGLFSTWNSFSRQKAARLNADGSLDTTFNLDSSFTSNTYFTKIASLGMPLQTDGKLILGSDNFVAFTRVTTTGAVDSGYSRPLGSQSGQVVTMIQQPDDRMIGNYETLSVIDGFSPKFARFLKDGTVDSTFAVYGSGSWRRALLTDAGELLSSDQTGWLHRYMTAVAPTITTAPVAVSAAVGGTATFTAAASGSPVPAYQWLKNGVVIPSATNATLSLSNVQMTDFANYSVVVSSTVGSVTSSAVPLTLTGAGVITITQQPADLTVTAGGDASFAVIASTTGSGTLSYQWRRNGYAIPGATTRSWTLHNVTQGESDFYDVVVSDGNTPVTPASVRLLVTPRSYPGAVAVDLSRSIRLESAISDYARVISAQLPLPDGRFLVAGDFTAVGGVASQQLVRCNADGSPDSSFHPPAFDIRPSALALQADGKILVGGRFTTIGGIAAPGVARLNADGSWDPTFAVTEFVYSAPDQLFVAPDQSIFVAGSIAFTNSKLSGYIARLNSTGGLMTSFTPTQLNYRGGIINLQLCAFSPSGEIYLGGTFDGVNGTPCSGGVARLLPSGALDTSFNPGSGPNSNMYALTALSNGQVAAGGDFTMFNGQTAGHIVRLNHDGTLDTTFASGTGFGGQVTLIVEAAGNQLLAGNGSNTYNGHAFSGVARLTATGAFDSSFTYAGGQPTYLNLFPGGRLLVAENGLVGQTWEENAKVFNGDGTLRTSTAFRFPGHIAVLAPAGNGKTLVAGDFSFINGNASGYVFRLNADLTLDTSFVASGVTAPVTAGVMQPDGKCVLFAGYNKIRLNLDGSTDTSYSQVAVPVYSNPVILPDGRMFVPCTPPNWPDGTPLNGFVLLDANGLVSSHDPFNPGPGTNFFFSGCAVSRLPHGQLLVTGDFPSWDGVAQTKAVRLNGDGTLDQTFTLDSAFAARGLVPIRPDNDLPVQSDGKLLLASDSPYALGRFTSTGGVDSGFSFPLRTVFQIGDFQIQADDRVLVSYDTLTLAGAGTTPAFARLTKDGALDPTFAVYGSGLWEKCAIADNGGLMSSDRTGWLHLYTTAVSPTISHAPVASSAPTGGTVTFSVTASGSPSPAYQWLKNGLPIMQATSAALTLTNLGPDDAGIYSVQVSNSVGSVTTAGATLTVSAPTPPAINVQPVGGMFYTGDRIALSVSASGSPAPTYQWTRNGTVLPGATLASLTISSAQHADAGDYLCTATNAGGAAVSSVAHVAVLPRVKNLSALFSLGTIEGVGTFTLEGSVSKRLLIRASGPALATFGVAQPAQNPQLAIYNSAGTLVAANSAWGQAANASAIASAAPTVGAFALAAGSLDSAVLATFAPGTYAVRVTNGSGAGAVLLELYDLDAATTGDTFPWFALRAQTLDNGTISGGMAPSDRGGRNFLVRASTPALGVPTAVFDPRISIQRDSITVASNDNWDAIGSDVASINAAVARLGAVPFVAGSTDAALVAGGNLHASPISVLVQGTPGTGPAVVLLEAWDLDAIRPATLAPVIASPPLGRTAVAGAPLSLQVAANGTAPLSYTWMKDGVVVSTAGPQYSVTAAQAGDAGVYTVRVTNTAGTTTSLPATVAVQAGAAHALTGSGYVAGGTVTITNTLPYVGTAAALGWEVTIPAGWSFASDGGSAGNIKPNVGDRQTLDWSWTTPPASPVGFTYTLNVPAGETGPKQIVAKVIIRDATGTLTTAMAAPNPLVMNPVPPFHSADENQDGKIDLLELTRVIELFNTHNSTTRTGGYGVQSGSEDGFAPDATHVAGVAATLAAYHSADENHDGAIDLLELTRVIELYNYRSGTVRTGQYHTQAGTEDGFSTGP